MSDDICGIHTILGNISDGKYLSDVHSHVPVEAQSLLWDGLLVEARIARQKATEDHRSHVAAMAPILPSLLTGGWGQTCPAKLTGTSQI